MRTHKEIFTHIYDANIWGGSGGGSTPENTVQYRALLQKFLKDKDIKSVIDYGCGDWSFSRLIDWSGIDYIGIDCVESVIEENKKLYGGMGKNFYRLDYFPPLLADLLILKDILQHWSNDSIDKLLRNHKHQFKYILITNTQSQSFDNEDIETGQTRGLSAKFYPLKKYNPEIIAVIKTTIVSEVSLISNV